MNSSAYTIVPLKEELIYISWLRDPKYDEEQQFLIDMEKLLDNTPRPVYFLSDVRRGFIRTPNTLYNLAKLAEHRNWAGSTAFSGSFTAGVFVKLFQRFTDKPAETPEIWPTPEQALA